MESKIIRRLRHFLIKSRRMFDMDQYFRLTEISTKYNVNFCTTNSSSELKCHNPEFRVMTFSSELVLGVMRRELERGDWPNLCSVIEKPVHVFIWCVVSVWR